MAEQTKGQEQAQGAKRLYILSTAPQIVSPVDTRAIMRNVLIAMAPAFAVAVALFGLRARAVTASAVAASVLFEHLWCLARHTPTTVGDLSAAVTGVLIAFNVPAGVPLWMVVVGSFVAIVLTKELFGGIGYNFANPAIVARIVLSVSFPAAMTTWVGPRLTLSPVDAVSSATMLSASAIKLPYLDMFLGTEMGMLGETSAAAILLGFAILLATRTITWHVTIPYLATVFLLSLPTGHDPLAQVLSGGLMLGAVFMATDYSSSPMTAKGKVIYGIGCGLICCVIRFWGNMNEGCAYSILLMDLLVPYIDRACALTPFGDEKPGLLARLRARKGGERQ